MTQLYRGSVEILVCDGDRGYLTVTNRRWGGFSMPGGKIEQGEDPEDAARRELLEEVGLEAERLELAYVGIVPDGTRDDGPPWVCFTFAAEVCGDQEPRAVEEGTEIRWRLPSEIARNGLYPKWFRKMFDAVGLSW